MATDPVPAPGASTALGRATGFLQARYGLCLGVLVVLHGAWAIARRFVLDDAFITFRYARHLAEGLGPVFNAGERVEGYTSPLWTFLVGLALSLGWDPVAFCFVLGPLLSAGTLLCAAVIARVVLGSGPLALLTVALLGANPSFAAFATGGLETPLVTFLQTAGLALVARAWADGRVGVPRALLLSLLGAAALLTRLDAALVCGASFLFLAALVLRGEAGRERWRVLAALLLPGLVPFGVWLAWKTSFHGSLFPNTFHAKVGVGDRLALGGGYLRLYLSSYWLWPFLVLFPVAVARAPRSERPLLGFLLGLFVLHLGYLGVVGGDFMEFRFVVPVMPALYVGLVWVALRLLRRPLLAAGALALVVAGTVHHVRSFVYAAGVESVPMLAHHVEHPRKGWIRAGEVLGELFAGAEPPVSIAVTAAGAIPYHSGLPTVDMLGLNDRWVAENGLVVRSQPGHGRVAPFGYLVSRGVNLVLGNPWIVNRGSRDGFQRQGLAGFHYILDATPRAMPPGARAVEIPLDGDLRLIALYLTRHPAVDARIAAGGWTVHPIRPVQPR